MDNKPQLALGRRTEITIGGNGMSGSKRKRFAGSLGTVALMIVAACGGSSQPQGSSSSPAQPVHIVLATLPVADTATAVLAKTKGYFSAEGLDVELKIVDTGPATTAAIVSGAAQFSQSNYATLINARSQGIPVVFAAEATRNAPGFSLVTVLPDSPIQKPSDLTGKRIATSVIGGIGPVMIAGDLKALGVDYKSINWVQMPFPDMGAALQRKQVDAAWVVEPFGTALKGQLNVRTVLDTNSGPAAGLPFAAWATTETYAQQNPKVVAGFRKAIQKAAADAGKNPDEIRSLIPTYTPIKAEVAAKIALEAYPTSTDAKEIQKISQMMLDTGFLQTPVDVSKMVAK
ncbi:MAG: ABC transporter substrate-binding protein [Candidatus Dormibacteraceae bacterium]